MACNTKAQLAFARTRPGAAGAVFLQGDTEPSAEVAVAVK